MENYIFITGASSGIGEACAKKFASENFNLVLCARRMQKLENLKEEILKSHTIKIILLELDVREKNNVSESINNLDKDVKQNIICLINNAGLAAGKDSIDKGHIEDWDRMIDTNVKGLLYVSRAIIPILKENCIGHIFNISSIAGKEVYKDGNVYCATKHAVDSLSKAMRIDLVNDNIKVTNIAPGAVETEFSIVRFKGDEVKAKSVYETFTPLYAKDIAETIYFAFSSPKHVNLNDITIMPSSQASATIFKNTSNY